MKMKKQASRRKKLVYKMLPKPIVAKLMAGKDTTDTFESGTIFFSTVYGFREITASCSAMKVSNCHPCNSHLTQVIFYR